MEARGAGPFEDDQVNHRISDDMEGGAPTVRAALEGVSGDDEPIGLGQGGAAWEASEVVVSAHGVPRGGTHQETLEGPARHAAAVRALDFRGMAIQAMKEVRSERSELRPLCDEPDSADRPAEPAGLTERLEGAQR